VCKLCVSPSLSPAALSSLADPFPLSLVLLVPTSSLALQATRSKWTLQLVFLSLTHSAMAVRRAPSLPTTCRMPASLSSSQHSSRRRGSSVFRFRVVSLRLEANRRQRTHVIHLVNRGPWLQAAGGMVLETQPGAERRSVGWRRNWVANAPLAQDLQSGKMRRPTLLLERLVSGRAVGC